MPDYFVRNGGNDSADGLTDATAWSTVGKVNGLSAGQLPANSIVGFKCGSVWNEQLVPPQSGVAGAPITFTSYGGGSKPQLDGLTTSGILVYVNNKNYLTFRNLDIYRSGNYGMQVLGTSSNITVDGCDSSYNYHSGMVFDSGTSNILVNGCDVHHNHQGGTFHESVTFNNCSTFEIRNCIVHDNPKEGIDAKYGSTNGLIRYNTCYNNLLGIYVDAANNITVHSNIARDNTNPSDKSGIGIAAEDTAPRETYNINVYNNIIYGNNRGIDFWVEVTATGLIHDINVYNNVLHANGTGTPANGGIYVINKPDGNYSNIHIFNNILWENTGKEIRSDSGFTGFIVENNLFKNGVSSDTFGTNYIQTADVLFTNAVGHNYHLLPASPAIDQGLLTGAPSADFDGVTRPRGVGVDIGAYEYAFLTSGNLPVALLMS